MSIVTNGRALTLSPAEASRRLLSFLRVRIGVTPRRDHLIFIFRATPDVGQGLGFGLHDGRETSARSLALIDTTIPRRLNQLAMVPLLVLIARTASAGSEATR